jgi:sulfur carrier protein
MQISVNGEARSIAPGTTIAQLLDELQMQSRHVAVEVNLELIPRAQHLSHELKDGDKLEVVTLVGGG